MRKRGKQRASGKRSELEDRFAAILKEAGVEEKYEVDKLEYVVPKSTHKYIIDFSLPNKIYIECKGYLRDFDERQKYLLIKEQYPELDLRFVFQNVMKRVPHTKMCHADWALRHGFKYCSITDVDTLKEWFAEQKENKNEN